MNSHEHALAWAETIVRAYARDTNLLIASRRTHVSPALAHAPVLGEVLARMGACLTDDQAAEVAFVPADATDADWAGPHAPVHVFVDDHDAPPSVRVAPERAMDAASRIAWARDRMPVTAALGRALARSGRLRGKTVGVCLAVEPKTAVLALTLRDMGADVRLFCHPAETDAQVVGELRHDGIPVTFDLAWSAADENAAMSAFVADDLDLLIDDGAHLIRLLNESPKADRMIGAAEETTSGIRPVRALADSGQLRFPVVDVNGARVKTYFDNAFGTGESCLVTILDLLAPDGQAWPMAGKRVVVAGFGPVGQGCARCAAALGARVGVAETDPVRELEARFAGFDTGPLRTMVAYADLIISATGYPDTITLDLLRAAAPGAVVAVAGGVAGEVAFDQAVAAGATVTPVAPFVERLNFDPPVLSHVDDADIPLSHGARFEADDATGDAPMASLHSSRTPGVLILDRGGCLNLSAGQGNPIDIMDLSFAAQLAALRRLTSGDKLAPGVYSIDPDDEAEITRLALNRAYQ